jgi:hypothetical protein
MKKQKRIHRVKARYIAVHCTATRQDAIISDQEKLPYHFLVTKNGRLINTKPIRAKDGTIEIAWVGGLNKYGRHRDNRTEAQKDTLFNTLIVLSEEFPDAEIVGADKLYVYAYANPGFDIKSWLRNYIPMFLQAA